MFIKKIISQNIFNHTKILTYQFGEGMAAIRRQKQAQLAKKIRSILNPTYLQVIDTTIGTNSCGQMYRIFVQSPLFEGKSRVQQHQMVSEALGEQLKSIHGFSLKTKITQKPKAQKLDNKVQKNNNQQKQL